MWKTALQSSLISVLIQNSTKKRPILLAFNKMSHKQGNKIKILESSQYYFRVNSVLPFDDSRASLICSYIKYVIAFLISGPILCLSAGVYVYENIHELDKSSNGIMLISAGILCCGKLTCLKFSADRLKALFEEFQEVIDNGMYDFP